jgi:hypothetical protein
MDLVRNGLRPAHPPFLIDLDLKSFTFRKKEGKKSS